MDDHSNIYNFTDVLNDDNVEIIENSQPMSVKSSPVSEIEERHRPAKHTGQYGEFRSVEEIDTKYRTAFTYPFFNIIQSRVIEDVLYSDKSIVVCAPTGSGKTVIFEMAIVKLLMDLEEQGYTKDFKIIYMAPVKAICTERLTEWYSKFTPLGCLCIEVTGDTDVEFSQLKPYRIIITTPEKWHILTRRWTDHRNLVEVIKLFLIDEVHILNDETRGPVLEAVVSRMKTIEASCITTHRNETLQRKIQNNEAINVTDDVTPRIRFVAVSATVSNPEDVAQWLGNVQKPAIFHKFGDECRPVKINRVVEGYVCPSGTSMFKFDIILNYKLWNIIQRYHNGKPTLIFCNTRKSVTLTAETLSREITITFNSEQQEKLSSLASTLKNKKLQALILSGVGCHHAGMLYEERVNIERAFRNRDLPILITTTTLAMGVNLPAHLVIIKNTQQYVNGAYQEYNISTILQMVGRAGRPQFDVEATAVIMTRSQDKHRYQSLVGGSEPLQSYLHRRLAENLNSEVALRTVTDIAQCVEWLTSTFLYVRAGRDPRRYLSLPSNAPPQLISKKIEDLCVKSMNGLASSGLIKMDDACCIESTEAGRLMSNYYLDFETMKHIMKIEGSESLERLLLIVCESHELAEMHLRVDERRCLNTLNRNNTGATIRFPMKGKITTRQMKLNCIIQSILGCLHIPEPSLNQEAMKIMRIADRVCKCMVAYITRSEIVTKQSKYFLAILNSIILAKCITAQLWDNSPYVSRQLRGIGPAFSNLLVTAGKNSFLLLEESHPRDLERIMNKGPPAGNILRKQISYLPKYQLNLTPVNHKTVSIKVTLLNYAFLSENFDNLTAGANHKCYIIVGDMDNCLLLFNSFRDKDLINVYDGSIDYLIDRKNEFEYKINVHCISSSFVGLDVKSEYIFKGESAETSFSNSQMNSTQNKLNNSRQTLITNTFKEKKRKPDNCIVESKEKRKRNCALIRELNSLKESLGKDRMELNKTSTINNFENKNKILENIHSDDLNTHETLTAPIELGRTSPHFSDEDLPDTSKILNILNKVENEMREEENISSLKVKNNEINNKNNDFMSIINNEYCIPIQTKYKNTAKHLKACPKKIHNKKDNFKILDLIENNTYYSDDEQINEPKDGFSESIKYKLNSFLDNTKEIKTNAEIPYKITEILSNIDEMKRTQYDSPANTNLATKSNKESYNLDAEKNLAETFNINSDNIPEDSIEKELEEIFAENNDIKEQNNSNLCILEPLPLKSTETSEFPQIPKNWIIPKPANLTEQQNDATTDFSKNENTLKRLYEDILFENKEIENENNILNKITRNTTPHVKINSIDALTSTIITSRGKKQFDDKSISNYKLELVKKVTLDVDVTRYNMKNKNVYSNDYNINRNYNSKYMYYETPEGTQKSINTNTYNYVEQLPAISNHNNVNAIKYNNKTINKEVIEKPQTNLIPLNFKNNEQDIRCLPLEQITTESNNNKHIESKDIGNRESIENILSKYCKVLKKDNMMDVIKQNTTTVPNSTIPSNTANKLFKIKNINNIDVDIPSILLPDTPAFSSVPDVELLIENKQQENDKRMLEEIVNIPDFDLEADLSQSKQEIDQLMLNPKTFLEHYNDNENSDHFIHVIPPPIEFSNAIEEYTTENDNFDTMQQEINNKEFILKERDVSGYFNNEKNIFEDSLGPSVASVNMSISHEIETWTLSPEEEISDISIVNTNPLKSCTVMRSNPGGSSTTSNTRKEKLASFKFNNKEKIKYKKMF